MQLHESLTQFQLDRKLHMYENVSAHQLHSAPVQEVRLPRHCSNRWEHLRRPHPADLQLVTSAVSRFDQEIGQTSLPGGAARLYGRRLPSRSRLDQI